MEKENKHVNSIKINWNLEPKHTQKAAPDQRKQKGSKQASCIIKIQHRQRDASQKPREIEERSKQGEFSCSPREGVEMKTNLHSPP